MTFSKTRWLGILLAIGLAGCAGLGDGKTCGKSYVICPWAGDAECNQGWIGIFNGENLDGWRNARHHEAENKWFVEDGALTNVEHGTDVATIDEWKDFDLHIEYKTVPGGNSGVYLRGRIEVQVLDSYGVSPVTKTDAGGVYNQYAPQTNAARAPGEWNTFDIRYLGENLTVYHNGELALDGVPITELTGGALPGGVNDPGPLMLQGDHGKVWYRNIRLRPLPPCP